MRRRTILTGLAAAPAITLAAGLGAAVASTLRQPWQRDDAVPGRHVLVSGCVLRFSGSDWLDRSQIHLHANGAHAKPGVVSARVDRHGYVEVVQSLTDAARYPVIAALCQADETLGGRRGIIAGATRGTGSTSCVLFDTRIGRTLDLRKRADRQRVEGDFSNLWCAWLHVDAGAWGAGS